MYKEEIIYKFHLPLITILILVQFFAVDIFSLFYLPIIKIKSKANSNSGTYYESNEYLPNSNEAPDNYDFVFVVDNNNLKTETYYAKRGNRTKVTYIDDKWRSTETSYMGANAFLFLPLIGFALYAMAIIKKMIRTKSITTWALWSHPYDKIEKLFILYGIPLFISAIIFGLIGRGK